MIFPSEQRRERMGNKRRISSRFQSGDDSPGSSESELDYGLGIPDDHVSLRQLNRSQRNGLRGRLSRKRRRQARRIETLRESSSENEDDPNSKDIPEAWSLVLATLPRLFFSGGEALLTQVNKKRVYSGIGVNHLCLLDLQAIYQQKFDAQGQLGHEPAIYKGLKSVVGQLVRFLVASGRITRRDLNVLWKEGNLFRACNHPDAVKVFIGHFKAHFSVSTVANKASQLLTLYDSRSSSLSNQDQHLKRKRPLGLLITYGERFQATRKKAE